MQKGHSGMGSIRDERRHHSLVVVLAPLTVVEDEGVFLVGVVVHIQI